MAIDTYNVLPKGLLIPTPEEKPVTASIVDLGIGIIQRNVAKIVEAMCREFEVKDLRVTIQIAKTHKEDFVDVDIHEIVCALPPNDFQGRLMRAVRCDLDRIKKQNVNMITIRSRINYADKRVVTVLAHTAA